MVNEQKIYVGVPTLSQFQLLGRLLGSIKSQTDKPDGIFLIDNSNGKLPDYLADQADVVYEANNLGVARSWNLLIETAPNDDDLVLITNDDNELVPEAVATFRRYGQDMPSQNYFTSKSGGFSCFCFRKKALTEVGRFDESFYPAYYEDNDYHHRIKQRGIDYQPVDIETYILGFDGMSSWSSRGTDTPETDKEMINIGSRLNHLYYQKKWGIGQENVQTFTAPFDLKTIKNKL